MAPVELDLVVRLLVVLRHRPPAKLLHFRGADVRQREPSLGLDGDHGCDGADGSSKEEEAGSHRWGLGVWGLQ